MQEGGGSLWVDVTLYINPFIQWRICASISPIACAHTRQLLSSSGLLVGALYAAVVGFGAIHLVRTAQRGEGGSSALRTPMYCFHSDVIICAYRRVGVSKIWKFIRTY